jgi:hypothetical protein
MQFHAHASLYGFAPAGHFYARYGSISQIVSLFQELSLTLLHAGLRAFIFRFDFGQGLERKTPIRRVRRQRVCKENGAQKEECAGGHAPPTNCIQRIHSPAPDVLSRVSKGVVAQDWQSEPSERFGNSPSTRIQVGSF